MKSTDRTILLVLPALALVIGFYMLVISPKRAELGELDTQVETLTSRVSAAETEVAAAEDARKSFGSNYSEIVSLGGAVPEDSDQATLIFAMTDISADSGVQFRSFELADSGDVPAEPAPAATTTPPATTDGAESAPAPASEGAPVSAAPTEADASTLPIGATVGPAGLPVMPYKLRFNGSFFNMADFFAALDKGVEVVNSGAAPKVNGRLMTVNGFAMVGDPIHGFPLVQASVALNTYIVPADQGLSAGATPAGPTVAADPTSTVTSAPTSTSSVPGAAAVSP